MRIRPISIRRACEYVTKHHRHHRAPQGALWALSVVDGDDVLGVAIVGRPVSRQLDDGLTCEVVRLCTLGAPNVASKLYGATRRVAGAMGYARIITYTLAAELGTSLRAAGWTDQGETRGGRWSRPSRERLDDHPTGEKRRWSADT